MEFFYLLLRKFIFMIIPCVYVVMKFIEHERRERHVYFNVINKHAETAAIITPRYQGHYICN